MALSLLVPAALALSALVILPLIAHMARQTPRERRPFGAMLLLERVVKRLRRRRRVKDWFLLLLRILALLAVVFGAAGLRWSYTGGVPEFGGSGRVVVIVDRSMSMSLSDEGTTLLARARSGAIQLVRELPAGTLVGAVVFGNEADRLAPSLTTDHERVIAALEEVQPGGGTSNLRAALLEARLLLGGEVGEVLVFSDEAGPRMVAEATGELKRLVEAGSAVIPRPVKGNPPRNVAVISAVYGDGIEGGQVTLRMANFGPDPVEVACEVVLPDGAEIPIFVDLPPEGEGEERITVPPEALGGVGRATCEDPDLPFDDARYFHLPRVGASRVLVVDGDPGDTPVRSEVYFLERALAPWGGLRTGVRPDVVTPAGLTDLDPETHRVVFLTNVADPRPVGPRLIEFVRKGGNLVISGGDNVTAERYNAALATILPAAVRKQRSLAAPGEEGIPLALPAAEHELFRPFSRGGRAGFGRVRSTRVLTFEPYQETDEVQTLARYVGGMPALVERRVGSGSVLVWTSTVDLGWSNLPLQAVFMPLVQGLVTYLGGEAGGGTARFDAMVGERVVVPLPDVVMEPDVLGPDKNPVRSRIEGSNLVFVPERPGAYALSLESGPALAWVAVNVSPDESDVRSYDSVAAVEKELNPEMFLRHLDLSSGLFGLALVLMLLQALVAVRGVS
ncbi:MAG: BatA and WFA domain-containing protein [Deltaproteobacteria bacterium]|nr:BatA and WFA domain-containing protein [Deltaproteobacteria bacterium]